MNRKSSSLKKPSNAARMRAADAAVVKVAELEQMLKVLLDNRNGLQATLCSVLAQKGGEVTVTPGTMAQLMETPVHFDIIQGPGEGEYTLRLVPDVAPGEDDAAYLDDNDNDGSSIKAAPEGEAVAEAEDLRGDTSPIQGS